MFEGFWIWIHVSSKTGSGSDQKKLILNFLNNLCHLPRFKCQELTRHEIIRISIVRLVVLGWDWPDLDPTLRIRVWPTTKIRSDPLEKPDLGLNWQEYWIQILLSTGKTRSKHFKYSYFNITLVDVYQIFWLLQILYEFGIWIHVFRPNPDPDFIWFFFGSETVSTNHEIIT